MQAGLSLALFVATYVTLYLAGGLGSTSWLWHLLGMIPGLANIVWAFVVARGYDKMRAEKVAVSDDSSVKA